MEKVVWYYPTSLGLLGFAENGKSLTHLFLAGSSLEKDELQRETPLLHKAGVQVKEYLEGKRQIFDLPLEPAGTDFQKRVWNALCRIPYGETRTYKQIAQMVGSPKAFRAVGMANHNNPIAIVIPCHRVVGSDGSLTGYAYGLSIKEQLLRFENDNA